MLLGHLGETLETTREKRSNNGVQSEEGQHNMVDRVRKLLRVRISLGSTNTFGE
jgi:hypothetical protein